MELDPPCKKQKKIERKNKIKSYNSIWKLQIKWAPKIPWAKSIVVKDGFINMPKCTVCSLIKKRKNHGFVVEHFK
jgi:hypothetical protein